MTGANVTIEDPTTIVTVDDAASVATVEVTTQSVTVDDATAEVTINESPVQVVTLNQAGSVTVETELVEVSVSVGLMGPQGPSAEDLSVYAERVDFVGSTLIYRGWAEAGSDESDAVWRIARLTLAGDDVTKEWADGSDAFTQIWDDRLTLSYS